jgi:hypothetical protein
MKKVVLLLLLISSTAYGEIYTWKDSRGTAFYSNSLYEIPARYLSRAKLLDVATGKRLPLSAKQGGVQAASAAPGQPPSGPQAPSQPPPVQQAVSQSAPPPGAGPTNPVPARAAAQAVQAVQAAPAPPPPQQQMSPGIALRRERLRQNHIRSREEE